MYVVPDSQVDHTTCVGHSQVDEQPQASDGKAKKIHTPEVSVDYSELRVSLISILLVLTSCYLYGCRLSHLLTDANSNNL